MHPLLIQQAANHERDSAAMVKLDADMKANLVAFNARTLLDLQREFLDIRKAEDDMARDEATFNAATIGERHAKKSRILNRMRHHFNYVPPKEQLVTSIK